MQGDLRTVRELAATGTESEVDRWYLAIRPSCDDLLQRLGSKRLAVETEVKQQDFAEKKAEVVARVSIEEVVERKVSDLPDTSIAVPEAVGALLAAHGVEIRRR